MAPSGQSTLIIDGRLVNIWIAMPSDNTFAVTLTIREFESLDEAKRIGLWLAEMMRQGLPNAGLQ
jgi:hypothetical protein